MALMSIVSLRLSLSSWAYVVICRHLASRHDNMFVESGQAEGGMLAAIMRSWQRH